MFMDGRHLIALGAALVAGCDKQPPPVVYSTPKPLETPASSGYSGVTVTDSEILDKPTPKPTPNEVAEARPVFQDPQVNAAAKEYAAATLELKNFAASQQLRGADITANPSVLSSHVNALAARLDRLNQARAQAESRLGPGEKARWNAFRKSLEQPGE